MSSSGMDCKQEANYPSRADKATEMVDAIINSSSCDGDDHGQMELGTVMKRDPRNRLLLGRFECVGEWRIAIRRVPYGEPSPKFRHRDFRNPQTGHSIVPTKVYVELQREVQKAAQGYQWKFNFVVLAIILLILFLPFMVIDFDDVDSSSYFKIGCLASILLLCCFFIWKTGMQWVNKSLHARMERVVQERQGLLMECGVQLGYSHETTQCYRNRSHLWFRRIPDTKMRNLWFRRIPEPTSDGELQQQQQLFPPIFIDCLVPGEIHISEKHDPTMVLDKEVWNMIQKAHFATLKPYHRYGAALFVVAGILIVYTCLLRFSMALFGERAAWLVFLGIMIIFVLTWFIVDRLHVKAYSQVADQVTLQLLNSETPNLQGIQLKFETSTLPFRYKCYWSRRYQIVRVPRKDIFHHDICFVDEKEVDHDDYVVHHMV